MYCAYSWTLWFAERVGSVDQDQFGGLGFAKKKTVSSVDGTLVEFGNLVLVAVVSLVEFGKGFC